MWKYILQKLLKFSDFGGQRVKAVDYIAKGITLFKNWRYRTSHWVPGKASLSCNFLTPHRCKLRNSSAVEYFFFYFYSFFYFFFFFFILFPLSLLLSLLLLLLLFLWVHPNFAFTTAVAYGTPRNPSIADKTGHSHPTYHKIREQKKNPKIESFRSR